ncbi:MAG: PAS domain-containing sensor histidine kinase, partial [Deltaproteobacteria bacterium]
TGYKKADLQGKVIGDLFLPEGRGNVTAYLGEVMEKGEGRTDSVAFVREDGAVFEADLSAKKMDLGESVLFQLIFRDLTDQRKMEKKILESKRSLQAIFDGIRDRLSLQSLSYEVLRVNRAVVEYHQTTFQDLIGRKCYEAYNGRSGPCEDCPVSVTLETKQPVSCVRKVSHGEKILRISSYPILDEKGNLVSILEYMQDITEQQRFQEELLRSEKLAGLGILTSGLAHEINNPLSGVLGMAEIAMEEEDPVMIKDYLKDIMTCGQKISEIAKEFSSYSRIAKREDRTSVDLIEVLENALKMVQRLTKTPVEIVKDFQPIGKLEANSGEIQLVFQHLITNAFQAMKETGGRLALSSRSWKDAIEIKVSDDGIGIPEKYLNQVFDPFFTTREVGEGKGLGLYVAYRIVTKYDGMIRVESGEHGGTTFTIQFPIRRDL